MAQYTKSTNFATKDSLPLGDPAKIVKGTEIDTEFNNIATAVSTKADLLSPAFTGTPTAPTASPGTNTTQVATTAFVQASQANVSITGGTISGVTISSITDLAIADGGTGASTASAAFANLKQAATTTDTGVVELATTAEAETGTDTTRAVTPSGVEAHMVANAIGWGQTWTNVTASRAVNTTYTNSTGRPIMVAVYGRHGSLNDTTSLNIAGSIIQRFQAYTNNAATSFIVIVPPGITYGLNPIVGTFTIDGWMELR